MPALCLRLLLSLLRDRLVLCSQFFEELNVSLGADPHARRRALRVRGHRVLALTPSVGLFEWRAHVQGVHDFLAREHDMAFREGRERLSLASCKQEMVEAHAADADVRHRQVDTGARAPASCSIAAAAPAPVAGPTVRATWELIIRDLTPRLHQFLLQHSVSPEAWLSRRVNLARSAATSSIGARPP